MLLGSSGKLARSRSAWFRGVPECKDCLRAALGPRLCHRRDRVRSLPGTNEDPRGRHRPRRHRPPPRRRSRPALPRRLGFGAPSFRPAIPASLAGHCHGSARPSPRVAHRLLRLIAQQPRSPRASHSPTVRPRLAPATRLFPDETPYPRPRSSGAAAQAGSGSASPRVRVEVNPRGRAVVVHRGESRSTVGVVIGQGHPVDMPGALAGSVGRIVFDPRPRTLLDPRERAVMMMGGCTPHRARPVTRGMRAAGRR
jgi:hypothetical protein